MSLKVQYWMDLILVLVLTPTIQYLMHGELNMRNLVIGFVMYMGLICLYRIMSALGRYEP